MVTVVKTGSKPSGDVLMAMLEDAMARIEAVRQALAVVVPEEEPWRASRTLDDRGPDLEESATWDEEFDSRSFADHVAEIADGYCVGGRLTDEDVRVATGAY